MHGDTVVDASLTAAPKYTKNKNGERDLEMHHTKKGNEWYFGMKVDAGASLIMCSRAARTQNFLGCMA